MTMPLPVGIRWVAIAAVAGSVVTGATVRAVGHEDTPSKPAIVQRPAFHTAWHVAPAARHHAHAIRAHAH
jgi:hypothetical protein